MTSSLIAGAGAVVAIGYGAWRKFRRRDSRDDVEIAKDRAEVNIVERLEERADQADKRADQTEAELEMEREKRMRLDERFNRLTAQFIIARYDIARLRRKLQYANVPDSEIASLVQTDLAELSDDPPPPRPDS